MLATKTRVGLLAVALMANLVLAGSLDVRPAHACSCVAFPIKDEIRGSDAVFSGVVRGVVEDEASTNDALPPGRVTFEVQESWKGVSAGAVSVYGQGDGANCYNVFEGGETYLVYASRTGEGSEGSLENNACGGTKLLADASADLRLLGPPNDELPKTGGPALFLLLGAPAAMAGLLVVGALLSRRN